MKEPRGWILPEPPEHGSRVLLLNVTAVCLFFLLFCLTFLDNSRFPRVVLTGIPLLVGVWGLRQGWFPVEQVRPFVKPVAALYVVLVLSSALSIDPAFSFKTFVNEHLWFPMFFLFVGLWAVTPARQTVLLRGLMVAGGASAALGIFFYFFAEQLEHTRWVRRVEYFIFEAFDEDGEKYYRARGMLWSYTRSALVFMMAFPATVALGFRAWRTRRTLELALAVAVALVSVWFLLLTKSRGVWIGVAVAAALTWLWMRGTWLVPLAGFVVLGVLLAALPAQRSRAMTFFDHLSDPDLMTSGRLDLWQQGIDPIRENPLLGVGYGGDIFQSEAAVERYPLIKHDRPPGALESDDLQSDLHSMYFQTLAEVGIVGSLVYAWLLALLLRAGWRAVRVERDSGHEQFPAVIPVFAALVSFLLIGVVYYYNEEHVAQMLWGMSGVLVAAGAAAAAREVEEEQAAAGPLGVARGEGA